jgi:quinol monooxygenase YgiN
MIKVIAKIEVKEECLQEFIDIFKANVPAVLAEDGCIEYVPTMDVDSGLPPQNPINKCVVTIVEAWESLDHLFAHLKAPHMIDYKEKTKDMVTGLKLDVLQPL